MSDMSPSIRTGIGIALGVALLGVFYLLGEDSFLLFHTLVELITIIVDVAVFVIAWNTRAYLDNNYLLFVGVASVFIAALDLVHALAYKGIGVFADASGNLATQLWVGARYLQSLSLVCAPFFLRRRLDVRALVAALAAITLALILAIFVWPIFPQAYVPGQGLTLFKKISEYIIAVGFAAGVALLYRERRHFEPVVWHYLTVFLVLNIAAEVTFTSYVSLYGRTNVIGHLLRLVAVYFLYKAIVETGLVKPYAILLRSLKLSQDRLRQDAAILHSRNDDLRRSEADLREHAAILQRRNEELDAYAHTVAHDLKTPLSVIVSASDLLNTVSDLPLDRREDLLRRVKTTALGMSSIIDELLLLSEVRKLDAPRETLDMAAIVASVRDRFAELIDDYHAQLLLPTAWPVAVGYAPWIEEVWANYLTNALKYGGRPPRIELGATPQPDRMIRFFTRDNGPGLAPEAQAALFVPFSQLGQLRRVGHGLGLSIVYQIVDKLGGQVGVESQPGRGSLFFFTLPLAASTSGQPRPAIEAVPS